MEATVSEVDEARLEEFVGQAVTDMGAAMNGALVAIGGKLGIWKAMAGAGPMTGGGDRRQARRRGALRARMGVRAGRERLPGVRRRMARRSPSRPRGRDGIRRREQPRVPAGRLQPDRLGLTRTSDGAGGAVADPATGFGWHEHDPELFVGTEQFFRPGYRTHLIAKWIPALAGVEDKLKSGRARSRISDAATGSPRCSWPRRIRRAPCTGSTTPRRVDRSGGGGSPRPAARAENTGVRPWRARRTIPARATTWSAFFDCLHDMGDPVGRHEARA